MNWAGGGIFFFFFFNDTATTEIYTLSLHDALPISRATLQERLTEVQRTLQLLSGQQLVDLHVSDLLNAQLPSRYDYTSQYDLLVFRRLASGQARAAASTGVPAAPTDRKSVV